MQWSENNLRAHQSLGQASHFTSMHLLIQHALFLVHHEYLPQIKDAELLERNLSLSKAATVISLSDDADPAAIAACVDAANQVVGMLWLIDTTTAEFRHYPVGTCAGIPIVTAASVLLWVHHCGRSAALSIQLSKSDVRQAKSDVIYLLSVLDSWAKTWVLGRAWANSVTLLDDFYQSRYCRGMHDGGTSSMEPKENRATGDQRKDTESGAASPTPLQDGDGFPDVTMIPQETYYKVRLITGLVMEQPELCKKLLQMSGEVQQEAIEQQADSRETDLDFTCLT